MLQNPDTDGDALSDGVEDANHNGVVDTGETDPCNPDTDGDGMPDEWETNYGFNPLSPADAMEDPDGDGVNNREEYATGTNPSLDDYHSIAGAITYACGGAGQLHIGAFDPDDTNFETPACASCGGIAEMTSPTPGSAFSSTTATFEWTDVGAACVTAISLAAPTTNIGKHKNRCCTGGNNQISVLTSGFENWRKIG